jgi:hypothetical protein
MASAEEFARAAGRGLPGIALVGRQEREARGLCHLHDGNRRGIFDFGFRIFEGEKLAGGGRQVREGHDAEGRLDGLAARAGDGHAVQGAAGRGGQGLGEAVATVGQRTEVEFPVGMRGAQRLRGGGAGGGGRKGVPKLVEGNEDAHGPGECLLTA